MSDPFDVLAEPPHPVDPDPQFARRLRARLERALALPRGVVRDHRPHHPRTVDPPVRARPCPTSLSTTRVRAIDWYTDVLGAARSASRSSCRTGASGMPNWRSPPALIYLSDAHPEIGVVAPTPGESAVSLMLEVRRHRRPVGARVGARREQDREVYEDYGHRNAWLVDPFGHRWCLQGPVSTSVPEQTIRHGDVGYLMWQTPDVEAAAGFYAHVLGWQIAAGTVPEGRQVTNTTVGVGLWGGQPHSTAYCCFAVDSVDEAVAGVRASGGTARRAAERALRADCRLRRRPRAELRRVPAGAERAAATGQRRAGRRRRLPHLRGARRGRRPRLLRRAPGLAAHPGGAVECGRPGAHARRCRRPGCHRGAHRDRRGHSTPPWNGCGTPGGTATDPEHRPYGWLAECADGHGGRFHLGDWSERG